VTAWSYANYATDVPVNASFKLEISEAVDPVSVNASTFYLYDSLLDQTVAASVSVGSDGKTLTLVPDQALAVGRDYYIEAYSVLDLSGNQIAIKAGIRQGFTTALVADTAASEISGYSIDADQVAVPT
ncbi:MAG: Ig-like domain-containing protein, partial [Actinobacteria bacterium]|nr:Ig-like domain-containing protein [Actinomycetota bacterium]